MSGTKDAQEQLAMLYEQHAQGLYSLALSITRRPDWAEDAVQDAFARLLKRWSQRSNHADDPVAYAFASVRNASRDLLRRRRRWSIWSQQGAADDGPAELFRPIPPEAAADPARDAAAAEQQRLLQEAVKKLPSAQREAVLLRIWAGLTFEQMSKTLNEPLGTVASRYRRALNNLKQMLPQEVVS